MFKSFDLFYNLAASLPLLGFPTLVLFFQSRLPAWILMWLLTGAIFFSCKWLSVLNAVRNVSHIPKGRAFSFLFLWPGMDAQAFLFGKASADRPILRDWVRACLKTALGGILFWMVPRLISTADPLLVGWVAMVGLIFLLHFGGFALLSLFWQSRGIPAEPLMEAPVLSHSLSEFWGKRWNRGFRQLGHRFVFQPLSPHLGTAVASFVVFFVSGLIHDLVIAVPARGGYGLPTGYFVFQGLGVALEHSRWGKSLGLDHGIRGWLMMVLWTAGPAYFLFPPPFVREVIFPMMKTLGALP